MIALFLIVAIVIYFGLFVFVGLKATTWGQRGTWWALLLTPLVLLTWDMPVGYYNFRQTCMEIGGLRIFENPPPAVRIRLDSTFFSKIHAEGLLRRFQHLEVVEAKNASGASGNYFAHSLASDGTTTTSTPIPKESVQRLDAVDEIAQYVLERHHEELPLRRFADRFELRHVEGKVAARWTTVGYRWTNAENTLLGRTEVSYCFSETLAYDHLIELIAP